MFHKCSFWALHPFNTACSIICFKSTLCCFCRISPLVFPNYTPKPLQVRNSNTLYIHLMYGPMVCSVHWPAILRSRLKKQAQPPKAIYNLWKDDNGKFYLLLHTSSSFLDAWILTIACRHTVCPMCMSKICKVKG